jgi:hypothetical protein
VVDRLPAGRRYRATSEATRGVFESGARVRRDRERPPNFRWRGFQVGAESGGSRSSIGLRGARCRCRVLPVVGMCGFGCLVIGIQHRSGMDFTHRGRSCYRCAGSPRRLELECADRVTRSAARRYWRGAWVGAAFALATRKAGPSPRSRNVALLVGTVDRSWSLCGAAGPMALSGCQVERDGWSDGAG